MNMKLKRKIYIIIFLMLFSLLLVNFSKASLIKPDTKENIGAGAQQAGDVGGYITDNNDNFLTLIQIIINAFLSLIGAILLIYMLYAGYNWMTARGEEEKVEKAKDTLKRAITGVIIIVAAYAISIFVMGRLEAGTLKSGASTPASSPASVNTPPIDDGTRGL